MDLKKKINNTSSSSIKRITTNDNYASGKMNNTLNLKSLDIDDTTYWTPQNKKEKGDKTKNKLN